MQEAKSNTTELALPEQLTPKLYIQILKRYNATIRNTLYAKVKIQKKSKTEKSLDIDEEYYYEKVCERYGIKKDKDDYYLLMMKRAEYYLPSVDPEFTLLLTNEHNCHQNLLNAIRKGFEIPDMDKDPLLITDAELNVIFI